jgi:predicted nucleic acid-binding Zn finger protein
MWCAGSSFAYYALCICAFFMSNFTPKGSAIADHIEGFKMHLQTAAQRLFEYFIPPEKNTETV